MFQDQLCQYVHFNRRERNNHVQTHNDDFFPKKSKFVPPLLQVQQSGSGTLANTSITNENISKTCRNTYGSLNIQNPTEQPTIPKEKSVSSNMYQRPLYTSPFMVMQTATATSRDSQFQRERQNESRKCVNNKSSNCGVDVRYNKQNKSASSAQVGECDQAGSSSAAINSATPNVPDNVPLDVFGSTQAEKMFIFTGTVERVIKWHKIFCNHFCYFEVIGFVISIQAGTVSQQKIMLLRDKKGPVLQVVYYEITHIDIEDFYVGKMLRCIGNMIGQNVLNAISIRSARDAEVENLERLCLICDQAVSHYLNV